MKCKCCKEEMELIRKWITYPGPSEWIYKCHNCGISCIETEDGYIEWRENGKILLERND